MNPFKVTLNVNGCFEIITLKANIMRVDGEWLIFSNFDKIGAAFNRSNVVSAYIINETTP